MISTILDRVSALGDETRTRILTLTEQSEFTVSELCSVLQMAQPTVSRHLKALSSEGWVEARPDGRNRHYRLSPTLDHAARELWRIVRDEIGNGRIYAADAERAHVVLDDRHLRSAAFFAETAEHWDAMRTELFGSAAELAPLLALIEPRWVVGDLGAGTGSLTAQLAPFAERVIGVDRSTEMLSTARLRLRDIENVELREGELESLPLADGELDVAILALVLHYVVAPAQVLGEVHRTLAPGGRILLLDLRPHVRGAGYSEGMGHVWPGFEQDRLEAWLADSGFSHVRIVPLPPDPNAAGPSLFLGSARA